MTFRIKAQQNDDHGRVVLDDEVYDTDQDAYLAAMTAADDYAELWYANAFHDMEIGLSTVWFDDGQYTCFWVTRAEE